MPKRKYSLRLKRIYDAPSSEDGARVLVDRVWPRGVTKEAAKLDAWMKAIAPSTMLRKWFGHDPARWTEFSRRYRLELADNAAAVAELRSLLESRSVTTLLYGAHDTEHTHAIVLADFLRAAGSRDQRRAKAGP